MGDITVNRAKLIEDMCSNNANKSYCEGYINQCVDQKMENGSDVGTFILKSEAGQKMTVKKFSTCTLLAPRLSSLYGEPAGHRPTSKKPAIKQKKLLGNTNLKQHMGRTKASNDMFSELFMISDENPRKSAMALMAHEIVFRKSGPNQSCRITPELLSNAYVGKSSECNRLNDILLIATNLVKKYISARSVFFAKLDKLQKNPLAKPDDKNCSLNTTGTTHNTSYMFYDSKTCDAYERAQISFNSITKSVANQLASLRKNLRKALETNFKKMGTLE